MSDIYVIGVGMTPFGKFIDRTVKDPSCLSHTSTPLAPPTSTAPS